VERGHNYRLTIEYDGSRYHGWQEQKRARTVAGEVRRAAEEIAAGPVELFGSGRTDAGVHALAQVASVRFRTPPPGADLAAALNERLPPDIHVLAAAPAAARFHARHSARARSYVYQISRRRTAFAKRFVWWVPQPLAIEAMQRAAAHLPGRRDLAAFCERPQDQTSTLVVVQRAEVQEAGALVLVRLLASHFLWKMVRRIVGTIVQVGIGRLKERHFKLLVDTGAAPGAPDVGRWTAPPSGLFLERVLYEDDPEPGNLLPAFPVAGSSNDI
jgi:tRNA pseudouridine38-40 synthase